MPGGVEATRPVPQPRSPAQPRPPQQGRPGAPAPPPQHTAPGSGGPGQQPRTLAGQPVARPVVPPRPDVLARLAQSQQPRVVPGQPQQQSPRPGAPLRPQTAPTPGQPIYKGPMRPGQPAAPRPGVRPGAPGMRPPGPRPMHPTARTGRGLEPAPPPPDQQRRPAQRPVRPGAGRERIAEREEKVLHHPTRRQAQMGPPPINRDIVISEGITVKELSEKLDVKASLVIKKLVERNIFATINQTLDSKLATELSREFGANTKTISYEEEAMREIETAEVEKDLKGRAPVVTIMGHVDHGKTSLLDSIRLAHVAEKEAGGITQHIGAYYVEKNNRKIVFIDTPGHEAFTRMRARGAKVTDIVVLVVAADDGVMPQTLEAIDHARAAKVPIIVAINKIDKPDAQPERVKQQLSDRGLVPEDWGGDTVMVPVSARAKQNLDLLLEMILLVAEMQDLKANPDRPAMGTVLESKLDRGRGPVATVLVRNGTLRVGDYFICGLVFGRVRAMLDDRGNQIREAEPSMPVEVQGLESMPDAGDSFQAVTDTAKAKQIVLYREAKAREIALAKSSRLTLEQLQKQMRTGEVKELPIILKTDVAGSAEVLTDTLHKLSNDKVKVRVLHSGVGAITESDVLLASASNAIIVGFNVRPERNASALAEQEKVDIRLHTIIYNLTDEIKRALTGMLEPVFKEVYRGKAEVREVFRITKVGIVAGCIVQDGYFTRDTDIRLLRDNVVVFTGKVGSLRRFKDDVSEVKSGYECGITIENFSDIKQGDVIEGFVSERVASEVFA
jgi:translation initiation factor IF-2